MSRVATREHALSAELDFEQYRRELTGYCYRMLGSGFDAEDAVQETMVRAWKSVDKLETPAALRSWLYRIASNVCFDMLEGSKKRARPMDLASPSMADTTIDSGLSEEYWIQPMPDAKVLPEVGDPAELAEAKETIRLAFVAALQHLPPKQRAVLILREVLRWQATEVAALLDTTVVSVNSALQRARATLEEADIDVSGPAAVDDEERKDLLAKYVDAFERYDIEALVSLLHDDATFTMPPYQLWLQGPTEIFKWFFGQGIGCKDSRVLLTSANGRPAYGSYKPAGEGLWKAWGIVIPEAADGKISAVNQFIYPELFPLFGLPTELRA
jgi:RNA polymerase sigma-70 factor (ECF subfamily)